MQQTKEVQSEKTMVLEDVAQYLRENYVAIFQKESENALLMQFVGGKKLRVTIEEAD